MESMGSGIRNRAMTKAEKLFKEVEQTDEFANKIRNGNKIQKMILTNDELELEKAYRILQDEARTYRINGFKQWICLIIGILLGIILAYPLTMLVSKLGFSFYKRTGLDDLTL